MNNFYRMMSICTIVITSLILIGAAYYYNTGDIKANIIEANQVIIGDDIVLSNCGSGAVKGIWISKKDSRECVAIYFDANLGPVIGVFSDMNEPMSLAMYSHNGEPMIQWRDKKGNFRHITVEKLMGK